MIYFPHDGPDVATLSLQDRASWAENGGFHVMLVGPDGMRDQLAEWLRGRNVIRARSHVCYNHLVLRSKIDQAMGNRRVRAVPELREIEAVVDGLGERLLSHAVTRHRDGVGSSEADVRVEQLAQADASDIAQVRNEDEDGISRVALLASELTGTDVMRAEFQAAHATLCQANRSEGDLVDDGDADDDAQEETGDAVEGASSGQDANGDAGGQQAQEGGAEAVIARSARGRDPLSEFKENGLHLMELFRHVFPLMRYEYEPQPDGTERLKSSSPLDSNGTLTDAATRHLLLQFTTVAANDAALIFVLANQKQRHSVIRSVNSRVKSTAFEEFFKLTDEPGFWEKLDEAAADPESAAAKGLQNRLVPLLTSAGKDKPWGKLERSAMKGKILGVAARHGDPTVFLTISPDDVHQALSIRLSFPSKGHTFPAMHGANASAATDAMLDALRSGGRYGERRDGTRATPSDCAADDARQEGQPDRPSDVVLKVTLSEAQLQRLARENAVATSVAYDQMVNEVLQVLVGIPNGTHHRTAVDTLRCLASEDLAAAGKRRAGIFGVPTASVWVTETSGRLALHWHGALWTCASPRLLARHASSDEWRQRLLDALDTQSNSQVEWEVHALDAARRALRVPAPRASFWQPPSFAAAKRIARLFAKQLGNHICEPSGTCRKKPQGEKGCRGGYPRGHDVASTQLVQLVDESWIDEQPGRREKLQAERAFLGSHGNPQCCSGNCRRHWCGEEGEEEREHMELRLIKPQARKDHDELETLVSRDDRVLALELARPAVETPSAIVEEVESCNLEDDAQVSQAVQRVLDFEPVEELLKLPMLAPLFQRLGCLTAEENRRLVQEWRHLRCANANLVDFNDVLTTCTGSNTAPYQLGAGQAAAGALFYLVKYFTKDSCKINSALSVLREARQTLETHGSRAEDQGPQRDRQFMMTRALNKLDSEIALTQAAAMLLGMPASGSSESFLYLDSWAFLHAAQKGAPGDRPVDEDRCCDDTIDEATHDETADCGAGVRAQRVVAMGTRHSDEEAFQPTSSAPVYKPNGHAIPVEWVEHYRHRGSALAALSPVVYCLTIQIVPTPTPKTTQKTRTPNRTWHFASDHPLHGYYVQQERSKPACPINAGKPRPRPPSALAPGETPSAAWRTQLNRAVQFYVANFVPWDGPKPPALNEATLTAWIAQQTEHAGQRECPPALLDADGAAADDNADDGHQPLGISKDRVRAAGALQLLRNFAHGLSADQFALRASKQYRFRNRREWTDDEDEQYRRRHGQDDKALQAAKNEIDNIRKRHEARKFDRARKDHAETQEEWLDALVRSVADATQPPSEPAAARCNAPAPLGDACLACDEAAVHMVSSLLGAKVEDGSAGEMGTESAATHRPAQPDAPAPPPAGDVYAAFASISKEAYEAERSAWQREHLDAFRRGEDVPPPPLNPDQRDVGRRILEALRTLAREQRDGRAAGRTRQEYSAAAASTQQQLQFLLHGAAGTGKSHLMGALLQAMRADDLGEAVFSAYTGVAVTALPLPAATCCTLMGLPRSCGVMLDNLRDVNALQKVRFDAIVGDVDKLTLLVLDEASFLGTPTLHHIDRRLQQLLDCDLPFGGLVVVLAGDFHQLQPVSGYALHASLVADAVDGKALKALGASAGKRSDDGADRKGLDLLKTFELLELKEQMRAAGDRSHSDSLQYMRDTSAVQPVREEFIERLQPLTAKAVDDSEGGALRFAKIGVLSNMERHALNYAQARAFAKHHNRPLFSWEQPLTGMAAGWLSEAEAEKLSQVERAGLRGFFVAGAPAIITNNIETGRGLVNGCDATMHSLTMPGGVDLNEYLDNPKFVSTTGGVTEVHLDMVPLSINAVPDVSEEARTALLLRGATLKGESVKLTLPRSQLSDAERAALLAPDARVVAHSGSLTVCADAISNEMRTALLARGATVTGELVVPVLVGANGVRYGVTSSYAARESIPKELYVMRHQIDLAFAVTDYKVQGKTLDYFVLAIGPRKGIKPSLTLTDLYVLASRVQLGQRLYVIGFNPEKESDHLRRLKHSPALAIWREGYTAGRWDAKRAARHAAELLKRREEASKEKRRRPSVSEASHAKSGPRPTAASAAALAGASPPSKKSRLVQAAAKRDRASATAATDAATTQPGKAARTTCAA